MSTEDGVDKMRSKQPIFFASKPVTAKLVGNIRSEPIWRLMPCVADTQQTS